MLSSIEILPTQIEHAWKVASSTKVPASYRSATSIVVSGMGGSTLGAHVVQTVFGSELKRPFQIVNDYSLPGYVDRNALVVLSSYSGTTEETVACAKDALKRKAKILVLAAGGTLTELAKKHGWPLYKFDPADNPSNQPRMAVGSSAFAMMGLLKASGQLSLADGVVKKLAARLRANGPRLSPDTRKNEAKHLAERGQRSMLLFIGAEHHVSSAHVMNNQLNENAKQLGTYQALPELNHHFLEGLSYPRVTKRDVFAILLQSDRYNARTKRRVELTAGVLGKNGIQNTILSFDGSSQLEETWLAIQFSSFMSFNIAMLHGIDPSPIPNVDAFKKAMA